MKKLNLKIIYIYGIVIISCCSILIRAEITTQQVFPYLGQSFLLFSPYPLDQSTWYENYNGGQDRVELNNSQNSANYHIFPNNSLLIHSVTSNYFKTNNTRFMSIQTCKEFDCIQYEFFTQSINQPTANNVSVTEFANAILSCQTSSSLDHFVIFEWFYNNQVVSTSHSFTIREIHHTQAGDYICQASNKYESANVTIEVVVYYSTIKQLNTSRLIAPINSLINLDCQFDGYPKPIVNWYFSAINNSLDAVNVSDFANNSISISTDVAMRISTLTIYELNVSNHGYFFCKAVNNFQSDEDSFFVIVQTPPGSPVLKIASQIQNNISLKWTYSSYDGYSTVLSVIIEYRPNNSDTWIPKILTSDKTFFILQDLLYNTLYYIRIAAINGISYSHYDQVTAVTVPKLPPQPISVTLTSSSSSTLLLEWLGPEITFEHSKITHYEIAIKLADATVLWPVYQNVTGFSHVYTNLKYATRYSVRIRAVNSEGSSPDIELQEFTLAEIPSMPTLIGELINFTSIKLSWLSNGNGGANITKWVLNVTPPIIGMSFPYIMVQNIYSNSIIITNLSAKTEYTFEITATNIIGSSPPRFLILQTPDRIKIPAITNLRQISRNSSSLSVNWRPPMSYKPKFLLRYQVTCYLMIDYPAYDKDNRYFITEESATFYNLRPYSTYRIEVLVSDGDFWSENSSSIIILTLFPRLSINLTPKIPKINEKLILTCEISNELERNFVDSYMVDWYRGTEKIETNINNFEVVIIENKLIIQSFALINTSDYYRCEIYTSTADILIHIPTNMTTTIIPVQPTVSAFRNESIYLIVIIISLVTTLFCCSIILFCPIIYLYLRRNNRKHNVHIKSGLQLSPKSYTSIEKYTYLRETEHQIDPNFPDQQMPISPVFSSRDDDKSHRISSQVTPGHEIPDIYDDAYNYNPTNITFQLSRPLTDFSENLQKPQEQQHKHSDTQLNYLDDDPTIEVTPDSMKGPPPPPPFSVEEAFGDQKGFPRKLTLSSNNSLEILERTYQNQIKSFELVDSVYHPLDYNNNNTDISHVQRIDYIELPINYVSTDI